MSKKVIVYRRNQNLDRIFNTVKDQVDEFIPLEFPATLISGREITDTMRKLLPSGYKNTLDENSEVICDATCSLFFLRGCGGAKVKVVTQQGRSSLEEVINYQLENLVPEGETVHVIMDRLADHVCESMGYDYYEVRNNEEVRKKAEEEITQKWVMEMDKKGIPSRLWKTMDEFMEEHYNNLKEEEKESVVVLVDCHADSGRFGPGRRLPAIRLNPDMGDTIPEASSIEELFS